MKNTVNIIQINPTVGDIEGNTNKVIDKIEPDMVNVTSELVLSGYPPQDLLYRDELYKKQNAELQRIIDSVSDGIVVVGAAQRSNEYLYNTALVIDSDGVQDQYEKHLLPTYDVFDEARYFRAGDQKTVFEHDGYQFGVTICEDAWSDVKPEGIRQHDHDPVGMYSDEDLDLLLNLSASPYRYKKPSERVERFQNHSEKIQAPIAFANQLGANDELLFDGGSFLTDEKNIIKREKSFLTDHQPNGDIEEIVEAIKMGISDYFRKTGFSRAVIGMSGGIDSSVAAVMAADTLGSDNVVGISLPSEVSSESSVSDAKRVADNLGIEFKTIPINDGQSAAEEALENNNFGTEGITYENIQARMRGLYLMGISNALGDALVITPDNKSEGAVGYCTLYGDTVGAIAPLGDLYKEKVYRIANFYSQESEVIPQSVINKEPTAELKEDQTDQDEIPSYDDLDTLLHQYIEEKENVDDITTELDSSEVEDVISRIHRSEFKRNQSPLVLRVSKKDLSLGWQYPIAADYDFINE